jgi:hypothetical protein
MAFTIDYISDWSTRLTDQLYLQFADKPNIVALVQRVIAPQVQALEDSAQSLFTITSFTDSEGVNLDVLGRIVTQLRLALSDVDYQKSLGARILVNKSSGSVKNIFAVLAALTGANGFLYELGGTAQFDVIIKAPITDTFAAIAVSMLGDAKLGGVRAILEWQEDVDAQMFTTALATFMSTTASSGSTSLHVFDTSAFPASGSIILDAGLAAQETLTYTVTDGTYFHISGVTAHTHSVDAVVELVGDAGQGFALCDFFQFAGAIGDTSVQAYSTTGFPASGSLILNPGLPTQETVTYSSILGTNFNTSALVFVHQPNEVVQLAGTASGGELAGAAQAP